MLDTQAEAKEVQAIERILDDIDSLPDKLFRVEFRRKFTDGSCDPSPKDGEPANNITAPKAIVVVAPSLSYAYDACLSEDGPVYLFPNEGRKIESFEFVNIGTLQAPPAYVA